MKTSEGAVIKCKDPGNNYEEIKNPRVQNFIIKIKKKNMKNVYMKNTLPITITITNQLMTQK